MCLRRWELEAEFAMVSELLLSESMGKGVVMGRDSTTWKRRIQSSSLSR